MDFQKFKYWLALKRVEGIGSSHFKVLLDAFVTPEGVFNAPLSFLTAIPGINQKTASHIKTFRSWDSVEKESELIEKHGADIITFQDALYPRNLLNIHDFPPFLYVKGILNPDDVNIAVVGSRMASPYGKYVTETLSRELALYGVTIISGLARGIDSAAHRGALAGKGRTIAVLGCGLDIIYPPENEKLFMDIVHRGAVITEYPFGMPPQGSNFPARNRIISGMSLGVVVVEATEKSGSLITARLALEQNREVFAVPGSIDSAGSKGTNKLIKEGAKLVETVQDILEEILPQTGRIPLSATNPTKTRSRGCINETTAMGQPHSSEVNLNDRENIVLQLVSNEPVCIDTIIAGAKMKAGDVLNILLFLELQGHVKQLPGKFFVRSE
ncbi:MAG: DNA-processing protein DprA [Deltaproteobacteria bacterium]|nr:DNA-processing protein DprA [Deltaproteobacteria bacterium]